MTKSSNINAECDSHNIYVGCAGWGIPKEHASRFASVEQDGNLGRLTSHLERYALRLPAVEVNSSFYRPHRHTTYERWAASVPEYFRFSVKVPREITHKRSLKDVEELFSRFLNEVEGLGTKLGPLLMQLPPSLSFEEGTAAAFFEAVRSRFLGAVVCEPRHADWFQAEAVGLLRQFEIARVAADPPVPVPEAAAPGGWGGIVYYRLHGSPRTYYSEYGEEYLTALTQDLRQAARRQVTDSGAILPAPASPTVWCIFDNTALGAATANALSVVERLRVL